ncbi:MAG: DUF4124 domain-containing protein [Pseudomonadota bacterium]
MKNHAVKSRAGTPTRRCHDRATEVTRTDAAARQQPGACTKTADRAALPGGPDGLRMGMVRALSIALTLTLYTAMTTAMMLAPPFAGSAQSAEGTYYRWLDESGKLVVSDRPPQDPLVEYEVISPRSNFVRRVSPGQGAVPAEVNPSPGNEFEQVDVTREQLEVIAKNPESCSRAKANLETLASAARIRIRDPDNGELRFLSEDEKETQRQKARDTIRVHCE